MSFTLIFTFNFFKALGLVSRKMNDFSVNLNFQEQTNEVFHLRVNYNSKYAFINTSMFLNFWLLKQHRITQI